MFYLNKKFGQNFLRKEVKFSFLKEKYKSFFNLIVFELGAGSGNLTKLISHLVEKKLICLEIDSRFKKKFSLLFFLNKKISFLNESILTFNFSKYLFFLNENKANFIGNLPYNLAKRIFLKLLLNFQIAEKMILMFQKEIGLLILAKVKERDYSFLTVFSDLFIFKKKKLKVLPPSSFYPKPKIFSVLIYFEFTKKILIKKNEILFFWFFLRIAFLQKRKTFFNNLRIFFSFSEKTILNCWINLLSLLRSQELSLADFIFYFYLLKEIIIFVFFQFLFIHWLFFS